MRDPKLESHLNELGIPFQYHESVPFSKINTKRSLDNQARFMDDAIDPDLVRQYRDGMKKGDKFPAVVVWEDNGEFVGIDGNHRFAAFEACGTRTIDVYEVLADVEDRVLLTYSLNTLNGRPQSEDDRDWHAVTLSRQGVKKEVIAQTLHIPTRRIDEALHIARAHHRASNLGLKAPWGRIKHKSIHLELSKGFTDDSVFIRAVQLTDKFGLGRDGVRKLRQAVQNSTSETSRIEILDKAWKDAEKAAKVAAGKRVREDKNPRAMANAHMEYLIQHLLDNLQEVWINLSEDERTEMQLRIRRCGEVIKKAEEAVVR